MRNKAMNALIEMGVSDGGTYEYERVSVFGRGINH